TMPLPTNDACANATPVSVESVVNGDLSCATTDGSASCTTSVKDLWYSYTPSCSHTLHLDTCNSSFDTVLTLYTGDCDSLEEIGCNDDVGFSCSNYYSSQLEVPVIVGERYLIRVAAYWTSPGGPFSMAVRSLEPAHDSCDTALSLTDGVAANFDGRCAQGINGIYCYEYLHVPGTWFTYTASCTGPVRVDYCDSGLTNMAALSVFVGGCGNLNCIQSQFVSPTTDCPHSSPALSFDG